MFETLSQNDQSSLDIELLFGPLCLTIPEHRVARLLDRAPLAYAVNDKLIDVLIKSVQRSHRPFTDYLLDAFFVGKELDGLRSEQFIRHGLGFTFALPLERFDRTNPNNLTETFPGGTAQERLEFLAHRLVTSATKKWGAKYPSVWRVLTKATILAHHDFVQFNGQQAENGMERVYRIVYTSCPAVEAVYQQVEQGYIAGQRQVIDEQIFSLTLIKILNDSNRALQPALNVKQLGVKIDEIDRTLSQNREAREVYQQVQRKHYKDTFGQNVRSYLDIEPEHLHIADVETLVRLFIQYPVILAPEMQRALESFWSMYTGGLVTPLYTFLKEFGSSYYKVGGKIGEHADTRKPQVRAVLDIIGYLAKHLKAAAEVLQKQSVGRSSWEKHFSIR